MLARVITVQPHQWKPGVHSKFVRRWKHVQEALLPSLRKIGLDAEPIEAVLSCDLPPVVDGKMSYDGITLTIGEGCTGNTLSNYLIWKLAVERNEPVLVLEDDAILPETSSQAVADAIKSFCVSSRNFSDILYLLSQCPYLKDTFKSYHPSSCTPIDRHITRLLKTEDLACTAAYVVTPMAARELIHRLDKSPTVPVDGFVHRAFRAGVLGVIVQNDPKNGFWLNDNWAEWNHKNSPELFPK